MEYQKGFIQQKADILSHYKRAQGYNVLRNGVGCFGLPAEQYTMN